MLMEVTSEVRYTLVDIFGVVKRTHTEVFTMESHMKIMSEGLKVFRYSAQREGEAYSHEDAERVDWHNRLDGINGMLTFEE